MISQYVETDSGTTPKGIEIWNPDATAVNFGTSALTVWQGTNGGALTQTVSITSGTLAAGAVWVVGTSDIGNYLSSTFGAGNYNFTTFAFQFNGDDALQIKLGSTAHDTFGTPGTDPGTAWTGSTVSTANQNVAIKTGITGGSGTTAFTDPSVRYTTVSTTPSGTGGLSGFGVAPASANDTVLTLPASPITFGRVKQNSTGNTRTLTISEAAGGSSTSANFTTSIAGSGPTVSGVGNGSVSTNGGSANQTLTLDSSNAGAISRSVTLSNTSNTGDTTGTKSVSVTGNVVGDRTINASAVNFGSVLLNAPVTGTTTLSTPGAESDAARTRVTLAAAGQGAQGAVSLTAGGVNVFDTGGESVDRILSAQFASGVGEQSGSFDIALTDEFSAGRVASAGYTATVYDQRNVSTAESDSNLLNLGAFTLDEGDSRNFDITLYNLAGTSATYTAGADFSGFAGSTGLSLQGGTIADIIGGGTQSATLIFDTTGLSLGTHTITGMLSFQNDTSILGAVTAGDETISITGQVTVVPEPASLAVLGLVSMVGLRRRRSA